MGDVEQDEEYERALEALSSLISGRMRKDSGMWAHAFEMMQCYLEASPGSRMQLAPARHI